MIKRKFANDEYTLSYNGNVFCVISQTDIKGSGTQNSPYVVNSTKGFLYLTNLSLSNIYLTSKHIELSNNIVLNDEAFDENGTPSGGDGKVYSWKGIAFANISMNGKDYVIKGMYINDSQKTGLGLFARGYIQTLVENLRFKNVYLNGYEQVTAIGYRVETVKNCHVLSGTLRNNGKNYACGLVMISTYISNCTNYASVYGGTYVDGILFQLNKNGICENNKNFGKIIGKSSVSGICSYVSNGTFQYCENNGEIYASSHMAAGIIAELSSGIVSLFNCVNYGKVSSPDYSGAIVSNVRKGLGLLIKNCKNYDSNARASMIGYVTATAENGNINIINCETYADRGLINWVDGTGKTIINIIGCKIYRKAVSGACCCYNYSPASNIELNIKNVYINVKALPKKFSLISYAPGTSVSIENVVVDLECSNTSGMDFIRHASYKKDTDVKEINVKSYIINVKTPTTQENYYYGSNFSGFYVSWRTGQIGLIALDGKGGFQGKIDEEWLLNKGYEKKTI